MIVSNRGVWPSITEDVLFAPTPLVTGDVKIEAGATGPCFQKTLESIDSHV